MPIVKHILSFGSGEISPMLDGRTDIEKYAGACKRLENFIPTPQGGLLKRPGLQHLGYVMQEDTDDSTNFGQIVEFQTSTHSSVVLILGGLRASFVDKGRVIKTSTAPGAGAYRIDIPWADADLSLLRWKQINAVMFFAHPLYPPHVLTRSSVTDWTLQPIDFGLNVPLLPENTRTTRKVTTTFKVDTDEDVTAWAENVDYEAGDRVTHAGSTWVCRHDHESDDDNGPGSDAKWEGSDGVDKLIWIPSYSDTSAEVGQRIKVTSNFNLFNAGHVGSVWEIAARRGENKYDVTLTAGSVTNNTFSPILVVQGGWTFMTYGIWGGDFIIEISSDKGETWTRERTYSSREARPRNASGEGYEESRVLMRIRFMNYESGGTNDSTKPYAILSSTESRIRGLVQITNYVGPREVRGVCISPVEKATTSSWSEAAWSGYQGYPRCIELHQNRLLFAATTRRPHTIWGSAVDDYLNFKRGLDADVAYTHTLAIGSRDPILWMDSNRTLVIGNGSGEFTLRGENDDTPITPEFGVCTRHSSFGSHQGGVGHIVSDTVSIFVQNGGRALREMAYSFQSDKYESANLNLLAEHLFPNAVQAVTVMRQPFQVLWVVAGGQLFSLTYERSQNVVAWARHSVGGEVIAVGSVRRYAEDSMHFLIRRAGGLAVERFVPGGLLAPKNDGTYLDSYKTLDLGTGSYAGAVDLTGHPLRSRKVVVVSGGRTIGPIPLTPEIFQGMSGVVTYGLPFTAICQPVTPEVPLANGSSRSRECRIHAVVANLYQSRGGKLGETPTGNLDPLEVGSPSVSFTGEVERQFDGGYNPEGNFCLISDEPFPFTIRSVALKLNYTGDVR